jgi:hypothetical protein
MLGNKPQLVTVGSQYHTHNHNTEITEKKAPTDESLRLLDEFRKEAIASVVERGLVRVESIKADIAYGRRMDAFEQFVDYRVVLNGKKIVGSYPIDYNERVCIETLIKAVSKDIAIELSKEVIQKEFEYGR